MRIAIDRTFRGSLQTVGQFNINDKWVWGWDASIVTDKPFLQDYSLTKINTELPSQIYLSGRGDKDLATVEKSRSQP